jgi:hypothetical protein
MISDAEALLYMTWDPLRAFVRSPFQFPLVRLSLAKFSTLLESFSAV